MTQFDFGTINPLVKTGTALASDLNLWRDAVHSTHASAVRPSYATAGMLWVKTGPPLSLQYFNGTIDIPLLTFDGGSDVFQSEDSALLGGNTIAFFRNAANLNAGKIAAARLTLATALQAAAGTSNSVLMTPLRVKETLDDDATIIRNNKSSQVRIPMGSTVTTNWDGIQYTDAGNWFMFFADQDVASTAEQANGNASMARIRLTSGSDAAPASVNHPFQAGPTGGVNLIMDNNEIMTRNNGVVSSLHINRDGGDVYVNGGIIPNTVPDYTNHSSSWILNAVRNYAHGLGAIPRRVLTTFVCKVANNGWAPGDELETAWHGNSSLGVQHGLTPSIIRVGIRSSYAQHASTTTVFSITNDTNWGIKVRAWL